MDVNMNDVTGGAAVAAEAAVPEATLYESPFAPLEEAKPAPAHAPVDYGTESREGLYSYIYITTVDHVLFG